MGDYLARPKTTRPPRNHPPPAADYSVVALALPNRLRPRVLACSAQRRHSPLEHPCSATRVPLADSETIKQVTLVRPCSAIRKTTSNRAHSLRDRPVDCSAAVVCLETTMPISQRERRCLDLPTHSRPQEAACSVISVRTISSNSSSSNKEPDSEPDPSLATSRPITTDSATRRRSNRPHRSIPTIRMELETCLPIRPTLRLSIRRLPRLCRH